MRKYFSYLLISLFILPITACEAKGQSSLIKSEKKIRTIKADDIRKNYRDYAVKSMQVSGSTADAELAKIKYNVTFSKVTYEATDPFGNVKILSGLIGYPNLPDNEKNKTLTIVSVQHGTLSSESGAPSLNTFKEAGKIRDGLTLIPPAHENGYIIVIPDYFGYGSDEKDIHYYEVRSSLAEATRKLIEAVPSFAKEKSLQVDTTKLYLFGYSEGGFATMSTLKSFSENPSSYKDIITVAGAGAYDKVATATHVIQQTQGVSQSFTASYLWVMLSYNNVYGINRDLNRLVQPEMIPIVNKYIGTDKIMQADKIPSAPSKAFSSEFVKGIVDKTDSQFMSVLEDNNVSDFNALGKVELIHGTKDTWVPTFNTDSAFIRLQKRGVDVNKYLYNDGTHSTTYSIFVLKALSKL